MKLLHLAWKNIVHDRLKSLLSILLMALGLSLICFFLVAKKQVEDNFRKNLAGIHLVVGAKGSPLQLVLGNLFHADVPTGNIKIKDARAFLNPKHPLLSQAVPLSLGDSHKGHRIVGTTKSFIDLYDLEIMEGRLFEQDLELVIGNDVANKLAIKIGDSLSSSHGLGIEESMTHQHEQAFKVVGILKESKTVADKLLLCSSSTVWLVHQEHSHNRMHDSTVVENTELATVACITNSQLLEHQEEEITALLLQFKSKNIRTLNLLRNINTKTPMMAASPSFELNKLFEQLGVGFQLLQYIAALILLVSALSIWFGMTISLQDRRYELALIKSMGVSSGKITLIIILEALVLGVLGFILAMCIFYLLLGMASQYWATGFGFGSMQGWFYIEQLWVLAIAIGIALLSIIAPLISVHRIDIAETLSES